MVSDLTFLAEEHFTQKDKLVLLTAHVLDSTDPNRIAETLSMGVASVRQSLAKADALPTTDRSAARELQAAIIEACDMHRPSMRSADHKLVAKVAADLLEAGATPDEVRVRARNLYKRFRLWPTPGALDKYWAQLADAHNPFAPKVVLR